MVNAHDDEENGSGMSRCVGMNGEILGLSKNLLQNIVLLLPPSSMHCPKCNRNFKSQKALLSHMNQPQSTCSSHFDDIANLADDLAKFKARSQHQSSHARTGDNGEPMDLDPAMDLNDPLIEVDMERPKPQEFFIDEYDGASKEYGLGKTFMMEFNNDRFSNERTTNLYYPFSSRAEWEFAFFLLRSDLSMATIDTFLSLKLVRSSFLQRTFTTDAVFKGSNIEFIISYSQKITRTR